MKKHIIQRLTIVFSILFISGNTYSQDIAHELSIFAGGGLSSLQNKTSVLDKSNGYGATVGVGYTYYFTSNFGIQTGIEYSMYSAKLKSSSISGSYSTKDNEGDALDYSFKAEGFEEKQETGFLQIPLMAQFQLPIGEANKFYIAAGGKIGLPIKKDYKHSFDKVTTQGYYPHLDPTIDDIPEQGFGTFSSTETDKELKLKTSFILSAETGMKWYLTDNMVLYTGVYVDYGLNDIKKDELTGSVLVEYNKANPDIPISKSVTGLKQGNDAFIEKINTFSAGVKIKLGFNL